MTQNKITQTLKEELRADLLSKAIARGPRRLDLVAKTRLKVMTAFQKGRMKSKKCLSRRKIRTKSRQTLNTVVMMITQMKVKTMGNKKIINS